MTVAPPAPPPLFARATEVTTQRLADLSPVERRQWQELLAGHPETAPFVDAAWVGAWCSAFGPLEPLLVCARGGDGGLVGVAALQGLNESWAGQQIRVLQSLTNVETPRYEFLASGRGEVHEAIWRTLCSDPRWHVIRLEFLPEDSATLSAGVRVAEDLGWSHLLEGTFASPWRTLPRQASAWDDGLKRKFKANLRNRERRLQALGEVTLSVVRAGGGQRPALDTFYALEATGWKADRGTAIALRPIVKAFYDGLVERAAQEIWIPILSVDGRPAAAQLVRASGKTLFLLKTAYDPEFAPYAPGQLLTAQLIRYGIEHDMDVLDFLGEDMTWKQDWEPRLRGHYCLQLFAPSARGRYAYWSRYGVRESVKRIPGARRLVRWIRSRRKRAER